MTSPPPSSPSPMAGGFLLAVSLVVGVIGGGLLGQPSIGFLVGLAIGLALMIYVWVVDRKRIS